LMKSQMVLRKIQLQIQRDVRKIQIQIQMVLRKIQIQNQMKVLVSIQMVLN